LKHAGKYAQYPRLNPPQLGEGTVCAREKTPSDHLGDYTPHVNTPHVNTTPTQTPVQSQRASFVLARWRYLACLLSLLAGMLPAAPLLAAPSAQTAPDPLDEELAYCQELEPEAVRDELNRISQDIFAEGEAGLDLDAIVAREWQAQNMDAIIDQAVVDAVNQVRNGRDWTTRISSAWLPASAESLTQEVATLAFSSEAFHTAIDDLSEAVALAVADEFAALSVQSAAQTMLCLQAYIGGQYSQAFVAAFAEEIRAGASQADLAMADELDRGLLTILGQHRTALGGVGVIIAGQIAGRMVQRMGQDLARRVAGRIAGRVLGRVGAAAIPVLGWVVGIGMIVYDVAESWDGALPQIQAGLQSAEVKATIRDEIVAAVEPELRQAAPQVARDVSNELYAEWLNFQRQYQQVLGLAADNAQFQALLSDVSDVSHLAALVDVLLNVTGRTGFESALASGEFQRLLSLPPAAVEILRMTREIDATLAWANLAGGQLEQVVALEIYKHKTPQELNRETLQTLIGLGDRATVAKLVLLEPDDMVALLGVSSTNLSEVAARLSAPELGRLARYVDAMPPNQANQLILQVQQNPELMGRLQNEGLTTLLARTANLTGALAFLATPPAVTHFPGDVWTVLTAQVDPRLFVHKYGWLVTLAFTGSATLILAALAYSFTLWLMAPVLALVRVVRAPFRKRSGETG
jgi:hypothetical protein